MFHMPSAADWAAVPLVSPAVQAFGTALGKGVLSFAIIAVLLVVAGRCGPRVAGIAAALPLTTAPTLMWLAAKDAPDYSIRAATNSMWATVAFAFFALAYAQLCMRFRPLLTLFTSLFGSAVIAALLASWPTSRSQTVIITLILCATIRHFMPKGENTPNDGAYADNKSLPVLEISIVAGSVCAVIVFFSDLLPAQWAAVLASAPVVGASLAFATHRNLQPDATRRLLMGYVDGCAAKIVYCFVFAQLLRDNGVVFACVAAVGACLAVTAALNVGHILPGLREAATFKRKLVR
jgi:hypothetical protein